MFAGTPLAIYTALGRGTDEPHLTALLVGLIYLVYALGEETGWRGFLPQSRRQGGSGPGASAAEGSEPHPNSAGTFSASQESTPAVVG